MLFSLLLYVFTFFSDANRPSPTLIIFSIFLSRVEYIVATSFSYISTFLMLLVMLISYSFACNPTPLPLVFSVVFLLHTPVLPTINQTSIPSGIHFSLATMVILISITHRYNTGIDGTKTLIKCLQKTQNYQTSAFLLL